MNFLLITWNEANRLHVRSVTQAQFLTTVACFPHTLCPDVLTFPQILEGYCDSKGLIGSYMMEDIDDILVGLVDKEQAKSTRGVYVPDVGLFVVTDTHGFWPALSC